MRDNVLLFLGGAAGYGALEVLACGHTHWTMLLTGGGCLVLLVTMNRHMAQRPLMVRAWLGAALITVVELLVGLTVNRLLNWGVWDYSDMFLNLWGQICIQLTVCWFVLAAAVALGCDIRRRKIVW